MHGPTIKTQMEIAAHVMEKNVEGMTHEDSLVQPSSGGNCANWVLGHIVRTRNNVLPLVGVEPIFPKDKFDRYERHPVTKSADALPWNELLEAFRATHAPLMKGIEALPASALSKPAPFSPSGNPDETIGSLLATIAYHEAYHGGQLALLRRVAGRAGVIKSPEAAAKS
jgi:uncharacterized damage-inducible protein DinB